MSRDVTRMLFVHWISVRSSRLDLTLRERDVPISVRSTIRNSRKVIKNPLRSSVGDIPDKKVGFYPTNWGLSAR